MVWRQLDAKFCHKSTYNCTACICTAFAFVLHLHCACTTLNLHHFCTEFALLCFYTAPILPWICTELYLHHFCAAFALRYICTALKWILRCACTAAMRAALHCNHFFPFFEMHCTVLLYRMHLNVMWKSQWRMKYLLRGNEGLKTLKCERIFEIWNVNFKMSLKSLFF